MSRFKESVKEYFAFTRNERLGAIWLIALCIVLVIVLIGRDAYIASGQSELSFEYLEEKEDPGSNPEKADHELFPFDPNNLPTDQWKRLGLTERQIQGIHNYENAGGSFKTKEDVKKMYTISDEKFAELEPYILIDQTDGEKRSIDHEIEIENDTEEATSQSRPEDESNVLGANTHATSIEPIDLNAASSEDLVALKGIGPVFSKNILKYRELLGGYASLEQLNEVYGLQDHPETVISISDHLFINAGSIKKINVNSAEAADLAGHIYIDWKVANALVAYRNNHGPFKEVADVSKCLLVDDQLLIKIAPYLTVE